MADDTKKEKSGGFWRDLGEKVESIVFTADEPKKADLLNKNSTADAQPTNVSPEEVSISSDSEQVKKLLDIVRKDGGVLISFLASVDKLKPIIPGEKERFIAVMTTRDECNPKELLAGIETQFLKLGAQEVEFERQINEKTSELETAERETQNIDSAIVELTKQIDELKEKKATYSEKVLKERSRIESGKMKFAVAVKIVRASLEETKQKINTYLQEVK